MRTTTAIAVCVAVFTTALSADYKGEYRRGVQARNRKNWGEAARLFRKAIAEKPTETGEPVNLSGAEYEPYLPQFGLGWALYNMQDCDGAMAAWDGSQSSGAVLKSKFAEPYKRARFDCEGRKLHAAAPAADIEKPPSKPAAPAVDEASLTAAKKRAEDAIGAADTADRALVQLLNDPALKGDWAAQTDVVASHTRARSFLSEARNGYETGKRDFDVKALNTATMIAAGAEQQLVLLRQGAESRKAQNEERARAAAAATAAPSVPPAPEPATKPPVVETARPRPAMNLMPLIETFMQAKYRETAGLARQLKDANGREGAQAALFGAAANYMLFVRGGERDRGLKDLALDYLQRCRKLDAGLQPDSRLFSPKFVEFFNTQK